MFSFSYFFLEILIVYFIKKVGTKYGEVFDMYFMCR